MTVAAGIGSRFLMGTSISKRRRCSTWVENHFGPHTDFTSLLFRRHSSEPKFMCKYLKQELLNFNGTSWSRQLCGFGNMKNNTSESLKIFLGIVSTICDTNTLVKIVPMFQQFITDISWHFNDNFISIYATKFLNL